MNKESILAMDPNIFLSLINMKLRDNYSSLEKLCDDWDVAIAEVENKLKSIGYEYIQDINQFK